jgi:hypothetical protein
MSQLLLLPFRLASSPSGEHAGRDGWTRLPVSIREMVSWRAASADYPSAPNHDAGVLAEIFGAHPSAGFFAMARWARRQNKLPARLHRRLRPLCDA